MFSSTCVLILVPVVSIIVISFLLKKLFEIDWANVVVLAAVITTVWMFAYDKWDKIETTEVRTAFGIVSLKNDREVQGKFSTAFTLGYGNIKEYEYYYFMMITDKGYKRGKVPTRYTYIREFNPGTMDAHVEYTYTITRSKTNPEYKHEFSKPDSPIYIYVPRGTIVQEFRIY